MLTIHRLSFEYPGVRALREVSCHKTGLPPLEGLEHEDDQSGDPKGHLDVAFGRDFKRSRHAASSAQRAPSSRNATAFRGVKWGPISSLAPGEVRAMGRLYPGLVCAVGFPGVPFRNDTAVSEGRTAVAFGNDGARCAHAIKRAWAQRA